MKNGKRIAALLGVAALLVIFCLPMFFALKGDFSQGAFMASLYTVLFAAIMGYVIWMVFRLVNKKKNEEDKHMIKNIGRQKITSRAATPRRAAILFPFFINTSS